MLSPILGTVHPNPPRGEGGGTGWVRERQAGSGWEGQGPGNSNQLEEQVQFDLSRFYFTLFGPVLLGPGFLVFRFLRDEVTEPTGLLYLYFDKSGEPISTFAAADRQYRPRAPRGLWPAPPPPPQPTTHNPQPTTHLDKPI